MARSIARQLRARPTDAEKLLWARLRSRRVDGFRFRRQAPMGDYVVDFYCAEAGLVVELDGGQHALQQETDAARTRWLESDGHRVLRFWNNEIFENLDGVLEVIRSALKRRR